jgi:acetoin utilization deacetylase AcuC-like enzyme
MGFCFLNNVAIAAQYALSEFSVDSVAIIDWDVHHGNGTQDIFYDRGDVFFTSLHEHGLYPGTGDLTEIGDGAGAGTNLNIPLPPGSGDEEYIASLDQLVKPALRAFDPDVVLVSVGFDAHRHDPISRMHVSTEGYGVMAERVREYADMAGAGIAFVLEGGYDLDTLADGVCMVHEVFEGWDPVESGGQINESVLNLIEEVLLAHQGFG